MSLYALQKLLYNLNRDADLKSQFRQAAEVVVSAYALDEEERQAVLSGNIGLLYVLGVNGQILMHFAAFLGMAWPDYIAAMRAGVERYGPVRAGVYAMTTRLHEKAAGL